MSGDDTKTYRKPLLFLAAATAAAALTLAPLSNSTASAATRTTAAARHAAWVKTTRIHALWWAEDQRGKYYCYGGTGPSCYDCSGLVYTAYKHVGVWLPRTSYAMMASGKLRWIPARERKLGDLAFYGSGHVELVTMKGTFGAADYGSPVWWHTPSIWWAPTAYYELRLQVHWLPVPQLRQGDGTHVEQHHDDRRGGARCRPATAPGGHR